MSDMVLDLVPDWNDEGTPFRKTWQGLGNIDQFRWFSRADVLEHLRMARDEIGLRHVRAVAMYSPEMKVWDLALTDWRITKGQRPRKGNWQLVDINLEALLALGLKPIYTTCFTPQGMSDDPKTCWPDGNSTGMPRDLHEWKEFVAGGIRHHIARYGIDEVRSWYFECWNEPNLDGFFSGTRQDFFLLWSATWHAVKSVDAGLRFGGPSTARGEWMLEFLDFTARDGTPPDYLISHVYNNDSESSPLSPFDGPASYRVKDSPHFATGVIRGLRKELDSRGWTGEVHWNEWGRSWFPHDPPKETALEAAFIVKTMSEASQDADAFAYWCLSDIYDQTGFQSSEFQGNYGMLSLHSLRKPSWRAHQLLDRLGDKRLPVTGGDSLTGAVATYEGGKPVALVFAYPDADAAGTAAHSGEKSDITVRITWPYSTANLIRIGLKENNIHADWKEMGAPAYPTPRELDTLRKSNTLVQAPEGSVRLEAGTDGQIAVFQMECPGVAFLFV